VKVDGGFANWRAWLKHTQSPPALGGEGLRNSALAIESNAGFANTVFAPPSVSFLVEVWGHFQERS
jgi:hypothetical protein